MAKLRKGLPKKQQGKQNQEIPKGKRKQKKSDGHLPSDESSSEGLRMLLVFVGVLVLACVVALYFLGPSREVSGNTKKSQDSTQPEVAERPASEDTRREFEATEKGTVTEEGTEVQKETDLEEKERTKETLKEKASKDTSSETPDDTKKPAKKKSTKKETSKPKSPKEEKPVRVLQSPIPSTDKDSAIAKDLSKADKLLEKRRTSEARREFEELVKAHPSSVRSQYGLAMALDQMAEEQQSNEFLGQCLKEYEKVWDLSDSSTASDLLKAAMQRLGDRYGFMGQSAKGAQALNRYLSRFPDDLPVMRELTIQYLTSGQNKRAKPVLERILSIRPDDGFSLGHLGFILKQELKYEEAIPMLYGGLKGDDDRSREGRFYFHLGDALQRLGRRDEVRLVYRMD